jgi:hypothetical protein
MKSGDSRISRPKRRKTALTTTAFYQQAQGKANVSSRRPVTK